MAYMMAIYLILSMSGSGPGAIGMTTTQVSTAGSNYTQHNVLPTFDNIREPPLPRRTSWGKTKQR